MAGKLWIKFSRMFKRINGRSNKMILIEAERISKEYPGVKALDNVSISLEPGEVHAIVGENGAGKSTFLNILSGIIPCGSFEGKIRVLNKEVRFHTSKEAEQGGISIIHQEPALVEEFTVTENIFLGSELSKNGVISGTEMIYKTRELLKQYDFKIDAEEKTANLGMGEDRKSTRLNSSHANISYAV